MMPSSLGIPFCAEVRSRDRTTYGGSTDALWYQGFGLSGIPGIFSLVESEEH